MNTSNGQDHYTWWRDLNHGGLLIAPHKLAEFFPDDPEPLSERLASQLRRDLFRFKNDQTDLAPLLDTLLEEVLHLDKSSWRKAAAVDATWSVKSMTGETIKPRRIWLKEGYEPLPLFVADAAREDSRLGIGRGKRPVSHTLEWLRRVNRSIALLTNGKQWRLIYAGPDHEAWCEWDIDLWFEEGLPSSQVKALCALLSPQTLHKTGEMPGPLLAAIQASRTSQAEVSQDLGERVRRAVEILIQSTSPAIQKLDDQQVNRRDIYIAASRIIMRCVVILFAEARDLLPRDNPIYHQSYGLQGLREQLDRLAGGRGQERLRHAYTAWPRLVALFRLVYNGCEHEALPAPRYGGGLFRPGEADSTDPILKALHALEAGSPPPSDWEIHRMLELFGRSRVRVRQGRQSTWVEAPVDFSDFKSEYIGTLYEGLLDYELRQAPDNDSILFLNLGNEPALPLSRLEEMDDKALAGLVEKLKQKEKPATEEETHEEEEPDEEEENESEQKEVESEEAPDTELAQRIQKWSLRAAMTAGKAIKKVKHQSQTDASLQQAGRGLISRFIQPGQWYLVRWGGTRKGSGTFYTPSTLTVPTVRRTLQPLLFDEKDTVISPKKPEEILRVKICDPAMGSGSFLLAALRYTTQALYESLYHHNRLQSESDHTLCRLFGDKDKGNNETIPVPLAHPEFEDRLKAQLKRHVVERCLYGVDIDPLAVELARMALWIETMDRTLPFGFLDHKLKCGNGLVGCWFDQFQDYPVMAWEREGGDKNHDIFVHHYREFTPERGAKKGKQQRSGDPWTQRIKEIKNEVVKKEMITWINVKCKDAFDFIMDGVFAENLHEESLIAYEKLHTVTFANPDEQEQYYRVQVIDAVPFKKLKKLFDAWCSIWFWPGDKLDIALTPMSFGKPSKEHQAVVEQLAQEYRFFHWELEFPDVYKSKGSGFDAVIGNPPWETVQPNSMEFFSNIDPLYRTYGKQDALLMQNAFFENDSTIEKDWILYNYQNRAFTNWCKFVGNPFGLAEEANLLFRFSSTDNENRTLHKFWADERKKRAGYAEPDHGFALQGEGKIYTYKLFIERSLSLLHSSGRSAMIVPSGIYSDKGSSLLRGHLLKNTSWQWLFGFENREKIFDIHRSFKFCSLICQKGAKTEAIRSSFMQRTPFNWENAEKYILQYPFEQIERFSPASRSFLEFKNERDLCIMEKIYDNSILLGDQSDEGWKIKYQQGDFNMTADSAMFPPLPKWEAQGYRPDEYGHWLKGNWRPLSGSASILKRANKTILSRDGKSMIKVDDVEDMALPLYEGRMIGQFDFSQKGWVSGKGRGAVWEEVPWEKKEIRPQYLMQSNEFTLHSKFRDFSNPFKLAFMDVTSSTNSRTMIASIIPQFPCSHKVPILSSDHTHKSSLILSICQIINSFTFDYLIRIRFSGLSLAYFILEESALPILDNSKNQIVYDILPQLAARLNFTSQLFSEKFSKKYALNYKNVALTVHERKRLISISEALVVWLYSLSFEDFKTILTDTYRYVGYSSESASSVDPKGFWRVDKDKDPELRQTVLSLVAFHDLQEKGLEAFLNQNDGEGWMIPDKLRLADYGLGHDDRAREYQPVAGRLGPRFLPWQLEQSVEKSWEECERHTENLKQLLSRFGAASAAQPLTEPSGQDMFGHPLDRDLFGNIVSKKR